ncbi:H+transporting two-sector ATPase C subunit [bacterium]|nr:H+transporting two-sector ATPase C subunit [bacterium]
MDKKLQMTIMVTAVLVLAVAMPLGLGLSVALGAEEPAVKEDAEAPTQVRQRDSSETVAFAISVAFTTSMACVSAAYAVGKVGAAALGAASERPELLGKSLLFVGLAEGIAIYGLIIAILLLGYLK